MKTKVFRLIIDPPFGDLTVQLFGSESERHTALNEHELSADDPMVSCEEDEIEVELPGIGFALDACRALVRTVEATGGTVQHKDGTEGPEADPDWIDLADAFVQTGLFGNGRAACVERLAAEGIRPKRREQ